MHILDLYDSIIDRIIILLKQKGCYFNDIEIYEFRILDLSTIAMLISRETCPRPEREKILPHPTKQIKIFQRNPKLNQGFRTTGPQVRLKNQVRAARLQEKPGLKRTYPHFRTQPRVHSPHVKNPQVRRIRISPRKAKNPIRPDPPSTPRGHDQKREQRIHPKEARGPTQAKAQRTPRRAPRQPPVL